MPGHDSVSLVDDFSADDRIRDARLEDVLLGDRHQVAAEHREVSELADFDAAAVVFLEGGESRREGEHLEGLLAGNALFEMPVLVREAIERTARDGGVELDPRI